MYICHHWYNYVSLLFLWTYVILLLAHVVSPISLWLLINIEYAAILDSPVFSLLIRFHLCADIFFIPSCGFMRLCWCCAVIILSLPGLSIFFRTQFLFFCLLTSFFFYGSPPHSTKLIEILSAEFYLRRMRKVFCACTAGSILFLGFLYTGHAPEVDAYPV